jgi:hypothetical protein
MYSMLQCIHWNEPRLHSAPRKERSVKFSSRKLYFGGRDSSPGIATGYELEGPGIESWCWRDFSHTSRLTLGAHQASCTMGTGSFPGLKRPRRGADHPPLLVPRSRKSTAIPLPPIWAFGSVTVYLYLNCTSVSAMPMSQLRSVQVNQK